MSRKAVLIVDDELNLLRALRDAVRAKPWEVDVLTAGNAEEALDLMSLRAMDVVVTDVRMPGADGLSLIREIRERYPRTRCLVMTAHVEPETEQSAKDLGAVSFIHKPFELEAFLEEVSSKLGRRGFRGTSLLGFSLTDILQLVAMNGQGLTFDVASEGQHGTLVVENGLLLAAETDRLRGVEAAFDILSWHAGDITSIPAVDVPDDERLNRSLTEVLMKAASRQDEDSRDLDSGVGLNGAIVAVLEAVEADVAGFLGSVVCTADGASELAGIKARSAFPREWLREELPELFELISRRSKAGPLRRLVIELDELDVLALEVGDERHLWISAVHGKGAMAALTDSIARLQPRLERCLDGDEAFSDGTSAGASAL